MYIARYSWQWLALTHDAQVPTPRHHYHRAALSLRLLQPLVGSCLKPATPKKRAKVALEYPQVEAPVAPRSFGATTGSGWEITTDESRRPSSRMAKTQYGRGYEGWSIGCTCGFARISEFIQAATKVVWEKGKEALIIGRVGWQWVR